MTPLIRFNHVLALVLVVIASGGPFTALRAAEPGAVDTLLETNACQGCDLHGADLRHLDADLDLEFVDLRGVRLEGAHFAHGVTCGPMPEKGGFGCAAQSTD